MKDHNPHDPVNMIGEAYELLLEKTMHDQHVQDGVDSTQSAQPATRSNMPNKTYIHWIENKKFLLKNTALEYLERAGDETTITLRRLNHPQLISTNKNSNHKNKASDNSNTYNANTKAIKTSAYSNKKKNSFRRLQ